MRMRLLNPGPVTLSSRVRETLQSPDLCHREPEFAALTLRVRARLESVYSTPAIPMRAVLLTGSGTAAVEAMVGSMISPSQTPLVVVNGVYGDRIVKMRQQAGRPVEQLRVPGDDWTQDIPWEALQTRLQRGPKPSHLLAIHHETATGRLNDIGRLGALCKEHGIPLLLDAVSSFGAEEIDYDAWNVHALAATANKCLHGVPGISFVVLRESVIATATHSPSVVLDLSRYAQDQKTGFSPFTQSVQALMALDAALEEFLEAGGWKQRRASYRSRQDRVTRCLAQLGVKPFLESTAVSSCVLKAIQLGPLSYTRLHDSLKEMGFTIYAGQGGLASQMFRISTMGDLTERDMTDLETALHQLLS